MSFSDLRQCICSKGCEVRGVLLSMVLLIVGQWEESCHPLQEIWHLLWTALTASLKEGAMPCSAGLFVPPWASVGHSVVLATGESGTVNIWGRWCLKTR